MKKWYTSKTIWVNIISLLAISIQQIAGEELIPAEAQLTILGFVNLVLRLVTKEELNW